MSDAEPTIDRPPRRLSPLATGAELLKLDLWRKFRSRKTLILFLIQLIPALVAAVSLVWGDLDGFQVFESTIENVYLPLLLPLAALFLGGPTIVDEVEAKTITFLTLRPLSRATLLLGKLGASIILAVAITVVPVLIFFGICSLGASAGLGEGLSLLGTGTAAVAVGAVTYTTIFALLGVVFASTLLPGIVYYVVFELIIAALPLVEFLSVKFHLYTLGGFDRAEAEGGGWRQQLEELLLDQPLEFDWWVGLLFCAVVTGAALLVATVIFRNREFRV